MVAWHEVPGMCQNEIRPVGYGLIGVPTRYLGRGEWMEKQTALSHRSYRALRDGFMVWPFSRHFVPGYHHAVPPGQWLVADAND
jgi:hypothetical protein